MNSNAKFQTPSFRRSEVLDDAALEDGDSSCQSHQSSNPKSRIPEKRTLPAELIDANTQYDPERYVELLLTSTTNLLLPLGYDVKSLKEAL